MFLCLLEVCLGLTSQGSKNSYVLFLWISSSKLFSFEVTKGENATHDTAFNFVLTLIFNLYSLEQVKKTEGKISEIYNNHCYFTCRSFQSLLQ